MDKKLQRLVDDACREFRWAAIDIDNEFDGIRLVVGEPVRLPRLGWVMTVRIWPTSGYDGPTGELLVADDDGNGAGTLAERFEAVLAGLKQPGAGAQALSRPVAETFGLAEADYREELFQPTAADRDRRTAALALMTDRLAPVAEHVQRVYGVAVPEHLAVFAAFWHSLSPFERRGMEAIGLSPAGLTSYLLHWDLQPAPLPGIDERINARYWCDPPEFFTVMLGNTDGLHYGLWYDEPAGPPAFVAGCYARDDPSVWTYNSATVLAEIRRERDQRVQQRWTPSEMDYFRWPICALDQALAAFADSDAAAVQRTGLSPWAGVTRDRIWAGSVGPALPAGSGDPRCSWAEAQARGKAYDGGSAEVAEWLAAARGELAAGQPAFALVLGRELCQDDDDDRRAAAVELLTGAYRSLGRDPLAEIALVHEAHRDLANRMVLRPQADESAPSL